MQQIIDIELELERTYINYIPNLIKRRELYLIWNDLTIEEQSNQTIEAKEREDYEAYCKIKNSRKFTKEMIN